MKRVKDQGLADGDLKPITKSRHNYRKYTDHVTDIASRRVVDLTADHSPCGTHLESLTYRREIVEDPIHDWPYAEIQEKITAKAEEEGIPVSMIDLRYTSTTCRKCGELNPAMRDGREFQC